MFCRAGRTSGEAAKFAREAAENERRSRDKNCLLLSNQNRHAPHSDEIQATDYSWDYSLQTDLILCVRGHNSVIYEGNYSFSLLFFTDGNKMKRVNKNALLSFFNMRKLISFYFESQSRVGINVI